MYIVDTENKNYKHLTLEKPLIILFHSFIVFHETQLLTHQELPLEDERILLGQLGLKTLEF